MGKKKTEPIKVVLSGDIIVGIHNDINKHYGRRVMIMGKDKEGVQKLPFNILSLDIAAGGFPRGRWVGLIGDPSTFKSSTLYGMMGSAQRVCGTCMKGIIDETELTKIKVPFNITSKNANKVIKLNQNGEVVSKLYLMDGGKLNVYCPGEEITHLRDLVLYSYKLNCSACRNPQYSAVVLIDSEHNYTKFWARRFGVLHHFVSLASVSHSQMIGDIGRHALETGRVSMLAVDSLDAQGPKEEDENSLEDWQMGLQARVWNKITRLNTSYLNRSFVYKYVDKNNKRVSEERCPEPTIVIVMQYREKIGAYGDSRVAGGGRGKEYAYSLNIDFSEGDKDWVMTKGANPKKDYIKGLWFNFFIKKSKVSIPYKKGKFYYNVVERKIIESASVLEYAIKFGFINQAGAWYTYENNRFQGKDKVIKFLVSSSKEFNKLKNKILAKVGIEKTKV